MSSPASPPATARFSKRLWSLLRQHVIVLAGAFLIFLLDLYEQIPRPLVVALLLLAALSKGAYFLLHNFKALSAIKRDDHPFQRFLALVTVNLVLIIVSYALDYFCLYRINPHAFRGYLPGSEWAILGQFLYLSVTALACAVVGDISPVTGPARVLLSAEVITGFITTIFVISNFSNHLSSRS